MLPSAPMSTNAATALATRLIKIPKFAHTGLRGLIDQLHPEATDYRTLREEILVAGSPHVYLEHLPRGLTFEQFADTPTGILTGRITKEAATKWRDHQNGDTARRGIPYSEQPWQYKPYEGLTKFRIFRFEPLGEDGLVHTKFFGEADFTDQDNPAYKFYLDADIPAINTTVFGDSTNPRSINGDLRERFQQYQALSSPEGNRATKER